MRAMLMGFLAAFALASCDQKPAEPEPAAPIEAPLPQKERFAWMAIAPSSFTGAEPDATLKLTTGYAFAIFPNTSTAPGDTLTATFKATGAEGGLVRVVLIRHCGEGSEKDSASEVFTLKGSVQDLRIEHTFAEAHPCVRLMFASPDGAPLEVRVEGLQLTKGSLKPHLP